MCITNGTSIIILICMATLSMALLTMVEVGTQYPGVCMYDYIVVPIILITCMHVLYTWGVVPIHTDITCALHLGCGSDPY